MVMMRFSTPRAWKAWETTATSSMLMPLETSMEWPARMAASCSLGER